MKNNAINRGDSFDEMFSFEATIKERLTPDQLEQIRREELCKTFGVKAEWLAQPEQRAEFQRLNSADQLQAAFAEFGGYKGSELAALVSHLRGES